MLCLLYNTAQQVDLQAYNLTMQEVVGHLPLSPCTATHPPKHDSVHADDVCKSFKSSDMLDPIALRWWSHIFYLQLFKCTTTCTINGPGQHAALQVTQHGACLGLGLAGLGSGDDEVFEDLKNVLYLDSAVAGEAAGLALGLLHVGTATEKATEMLAYAHDTQHEKVRSLSAPQRPHSVYSFTSLCSDVGSYIM